MLVKVPYGHVLPAPVDKETNRFLLSWLSAEVPVSVLTLESLLKTVLEEKLTNTKEFSIHADFYTLQTRRFLNDLLSCYLDHDVANLTLPF